MYVRIIDVRVVCGLNNNYNTNKLSYVSLCKKK